MSEEIHKVTKEFTLKEFEELNEFLDAENLPEMRMIRALASDHYDFSGRDHINCYTESNFRKGWLHALEQTRERISCSTMEGFIDLHFIFGYSIKRIVYGLFEAGFRNFSLPIVNNYLRRNKHRLLQERKKFMDQLDQVTKGVFQEMQGRVMSAEKATLNIYLDKIEKIQNELAILDPVEESSKFKRLNNLLKELQESANKMNGIDGLRAASAEVAKSSEIAKQKRMIDSGWMDQQLKAIADRKNAENGILGDGTEKDAEVVDVG